MVTKYTDEQTYTLIDLYFRDHRREAPWPIIAQTMGVDNPGALDELLWKIVTGYKGKDPDGPRRVFKRPIKSRWYRKQRHWYKRENDALVAALMGKGQKRDPPCDIAYIATVLARAVDEVKDQWKCINGHPLGCKGFFGG